MWSGPSGVVSSTFHAAQARGAPSLLSAKVVLSPPGQRIILIEWKQAGVLVMTLVVRDEMVQVAWCAAGICATGVFW